MSLYSNTLSILGTINFLGMSHMEYSFIFCPFSTKIRLQLYVTTFQFYVIPKKSDPFGIKRYTHKVAKQRKIPIY